MSLLQALGLPRRPGRPVGANLLDRRQSAPRVAPGGGARPSSGLRADVAAAPEVWRETVCAPPQWYVDLARRQAGVPVERRTGAGQWMWLCSDCELVSESGTQGMAEYLARGHDVVHHHGSRTAELVPVAGGAR